MLSRLDAVQPLLSALLAEPPPSLTIVGQDPATRLVWMGVVNVICFVIPPSSNSNPKSLILWVGGDQSGDYYPNSLGSGDLAMPAGPQGCANFTVSRGVAVGPYTIALQGPWGREFATVGLYADAATLVESAFTLFTATTGAITVSWGMPSSRASATDAVWVRNADGAVAYWFYTSCGCQTAPGRVASTNGTHVVRVSKPVARGGYAVELHPSNGDAMAVAATDWIPWAQFNW